MRLQTQPPRPSPTSRRRSLLSIGGSVLAAVLIAACGGPPASSADPSPTVRRIFGQDHTRGYSDAVRYGDLIWTAGHLPEAAPGGDVATQTRAVMDELRATLEEAGAGFDTVVMTNVYLTDFDTWSEFNNAYVQYFPFGELPPRVTVEVSELGFGNVEISMVAHVRESPAASPSP